MPVMRRWAFPLLFGLVLAGLAYQMALVAAPRLLMNAAIRRVVALGGVNVLRPAPMATAQYRTIVRPSPDLAYSSCVFDLSEGPVLVEAAPVPSPYWSLSVFDPRTDVAFVRNNRATRNGPIRIALARPGQNVPAGIETVTIDGERGIALIRILIERAEAFPAIDRARRASFCRRL
jgi:uncharacterized membrane protein